MKPKVGWVPSILFYHWWQPVDRNKYVIACDVTKTRRSRVAEYYIYPRGRLDELPVARCPACERWLEEHKLECTVARMLE